MIVVSASDRVILASWYNPWQFFGYLDHDDDNDGDDDDESDDDGDDDDESDDDDDDDNLPHKCFF